MISPETVSILINIRVDAKDVSMKNSFLSLFFLLGFSGTSVASVVDFNNVYVPSFKAEAQLVTRSEMKVTEAYVELYTDFIQCLIACKYDLKVSVERVNFVQSSDGEISLSHLKSKTKRFYKLASRVNECGASLVVKGIMGKKTYFSRLDLYKKFSKSSKMSCTKSQDIERTLEEIFSRPLELKRWVEIDPSL